MRRRAAEARQRTGRWGKDTLTAAACAEQIPLSDWRDLIHRRAPKGYEAIFLNVEMNARSRLLDRQMPTSLQ